MPEKEAKKGSKYWKNIDIFVAPSRIAAYSMCVSCMMNPRKIFYCGQARNDQLLKSSHAERLKKIIPENIVYDKIVLYAPTYRRHEQIKFFPFDDFLIEKLNAFLEKNKAVLFIRGHVNDSLSKKITSERVRNLNQEQCADVQDVLNEVSLLVTDYSSIYIDYLLLDRPVIFVPYDLDCYTSECGFVVDDYNFWTPGPKVFDFESFINAMNEYFAGNDEYKEKRQTINKLLNYYEDENSCKKIVSMIISKIFKK
jgi:CDP-glycerol glycerophosphotransferase